MDLHRSALLTKPFEKGRLWTKDFLIAFSAALACHILLFSFIRISSSTHPHGYTPLPFTSVEAVITPEKRAPIERVSEIPTPFQNPSEPLLRSPALRKSYERWELICGVSP